MLKAGRRRHEQLASDHLVTAAVVREARTSSGIQSGWRRFRAERFLEITPLKESFVPKGAFRPLERPEELLSTDEAIRPKVVFESRIARWLRERYPGGRDLPDGRHEVMFPVADPTWFVREMLQYGAEAEVAEPGSLREAVRGMVS